MKHAPGERCLLSGQSLSPAPIFYHRLRRQCTSKINAVKPHTYILEDGNGLNHWQMCLEVPGWKNVSEQHMSGATRAWRSPSGPDSTSMARTCMDGPVCASRACCIMHVQQHMHGPPCTNSPVLMHMKILRAMRALPSLSEAGRKQRLRAADEREQRKGTSGPHTERCSCRCLHIPMLLPERRQASLIDCTWLLLSIQNKRDHDPDTTNLEKLFYTTSSSLFVCLV